jgi:hypothetical protein
MGVYTKEIDINGRLHFAFKVSFQSAQDRPFPIANKRTKNPCTALCSALMLHMHICEPVHDCEQTTAILFHSMFRCFDRFGAVQKSVNNKLQLESCRVCVCVFVYLRTSTSNVARFSQSCAACSSLSAFSFTSHAYTKHPRSRKCSTVTFPMPDAAPSVLGSMKTNECSKTENYQSQEPPCHVDQYLPLQA